MMICGLFVTINLFFELVFLLGDSLRMEQVRLRSSATQAKIIGAILSISGALVVVLYKGPQVLASASFTTVLPTVTLHQHLTSIESSWIIGGLLLASQYFLISVWYILQVQTLENFTKKDFGFTH